MARAATARSASAGRRAADRPAGGFNLARGLWRLLGSTRLALALIAVLVVAGLIGTVLPQLPGAMRGNAAATDAWLAFQEGKYGVFTQPFYRLGLFDTYNSRWFAVLLAMLVISVSVYTLTRLADMWRDIRHPRERVPDAFFERSRRRAELAAPAGGARALVAALERRRFAVKSFAEGDATYLFADRFAWAQVGTLFTHAALVLLLVGGFVSRLGGFESNRLIAEGETAPVFDSLSRSDQMQVYVEDATASFDEEGSPLDYRTELVIYQGGEEVARGVTSVNGPVSYGGYRFHQAAYLGDGAALRAVDPASGRALFSEVLPLEESTPAPRVLISDSLGRAVVADVIVPTDFIEGASGTLVDLPEKDLALWVGIRPNATTGEWELLVFEPSDDGAGVQLVVPQGVSETADGLTFQLESVTSLPTARVEELPGFEGEALLVMAPDAEGESYLTVLGAPEGRAVTLRPGAPFAAGGYEYEFRGRREFAGISVRRDPGVNLIWAGAGALLAGLVVTFYVPRRRLWAKIARGRAWFAGQTGPATDFESEMSKLAADAESDADGTPGNVKGSGWEA